MEKKLRSLFDYQRFEQNPRLNKVIRDVEKKYYDSAGASVGQLDDEELFFVNAAGVNPAELMKRGETERNGD